MFETADQLLLQRRIDEFAEAFTLDFLSGKIGEDSEVERLASVCAQDGIPRNIISLARKAGVVQASQPGGNPL